MKNEFSIRDTFVVKGVAIIMMMIHHCFTTTERFKGFHIDFAPFSQNSVVFVSGFLKICVGIFVFLTAFGITTSLKMKYKDYKLSRHQWVMNTGKRYFGLMYRWVYLFLVSQVFCFFYDRLQYKIYGKSAKGIFYCILDGLGLAELFKTPTLVPTWWYMTVAIIIIFIMPLLIMSYRKVGLLLLPLALLVPRAMGLIPYTDPNSVFRFGMALVLGIVCADKEVFQKLRNFQITSFRPLSKCIKAVVLVAIFVLCIYGRQRGIQTLCEFNDGIVPAFIVYFCYELICDIKGVSSVLVFLGKHSMTIFLLHSFIRGIYFGKFLYGLGNAWLIVLFLLGSSLVISVVLDGFSRLVRYDKWMKKLQKRFFVETSKG